MSRRSTLGLLAAPVLLSTGCAHRGLASGPGSPPGAATWAAVWLAALGAAVVAAALVLLPRRPRGGSVLASGLLALEAGAAFVGGAVLLGAAVRSGQLITQVAGAHPATSLLRLSGLDGGRAAFFWLMAAVLAVLVVLLVVVLGLAARSAADADPVDRGLAFGLLVVQSLLCVVALGLVAWGERRLVVVLPAAALPLVIIAAVASRPRAGKLAETEPGVVGYNHPHG